jgi:hypothetical protein
MLLQLYGEIRGKEGGGVGADAKRLSASGGMDDFVIIHPLAHDF